MKCNRCGKENPAEIHTCTPKVLVLADALETFHNPHDKQAAALAALRAGESCMA